MFLSLLWIRIGVNSDPDPNPDFFLKGHGNEADFLGFLQKSVWHWSLTLYFEPFRFWLRIRGDIRNRKTTRRLGESGSCRLSDSANRGVAMVSQGVEIFLIYHEIKTDKSAL